MPLNLSPAWGGIPGIYVIGPAKGDFPCRAGKEFAPLARVCRRDGVLTPAPWRGIACWGAGVFCDLALKLKPATCVRLLFRLQYPIIPKGGRDARGRLWDLTHGIVAWRILMR